jgi:hypothetical protein
MIFKYHLIKHLLVIVLMGMLPVLKEHVCYPVWSMECLILVDHHTQLLMAVILVTVTMEWLVALECYVPHV